MTAPHCAGCGSLYMLTGDLCEVCRFTWGSVERMRECRALGWERRAEWPAKVEAVAHV